VAPGAGVDRAPTSDRAGRARPPAAHRSRTARTACQRGRPGWPSGVGSYGPWPPQRHEYGGWWYCSSLSPCPGSATHTFKRESYVRSTGMLDRGTPARTGAEDIEPGQRVFGAPRRIRTFDLPLRRSSHGHSSSAHLLARARMLGLWLQLDVPGFRLVRARGGHGAVSSRTVGTTESVTGGTQLAWTRAARS
jgi:hypothetical protein